MARKNDDALLASMSKRRDPEKLSRDMESTPFAQLAAQVKESTMIPLANIYTSPFQSRVEGDREDEEMDEDYISDLAQTIEQDGLLNPIIVRVLESNTPRVGQKRVLESNTPHAPGPLYELIAGENRTRAHNVLGLEVVPGKVLHLTDIEAARALTVDNLVRKLMTDWELYLHVVMLRDVGAAGTHKELASLLGCSRTKVLQLECFGKLPERVHQILGKKPGLLGANQVYELTKAGLVEAAPDTVVEAVEKVAEGKINQSGMIGFVQRKVEKPFATQRKEFKLAGPQNVRIVTTETEAKIVGDIDFDKLRVLIEQNLPALRRTEDQIVDDQ